MVSSLSFIFGAILEAQKKTTSGELGRMTRRCVPFEQYTRQ